MAAHLNNRKRPAGIVRHRSDRTAGIFRLAAFVIGLLLAFLALRAPAWQMAEPDSSVSKQATEDRSRV